MDWQNKKLEIGIGLLGLALFSFMYVSTHQEYKPATGFFKNFEMGFEMPKFRSMLQFFSLEGREIDRQESPEDEISHEGLKPLHDRKMTRPTVAKIDNKSIGQKIVDDKNKKKTTATTTRTNTQGQRRPVISVNTQNGGDRYKSAFDSNSQEEKTTSTEEVIANNSVPYVAPPAAEEPVAQKKEDKEVLGLEYWRNLLVSSPTPSTAYKIVEALGKKKITDKDFFTLVEMLLQSKTSGYQKLGLYMVYNQSNSNAFAVVAKNYDGLQGDLAKTADNYFLSFNEKGKIGVLAGALASTLPKVQMHALSALLTGLQSIRNGQSPVPVDARSQRGGQVVSYDAKAYTQLLPQLQKLVMSSDSQISQTATHVISLLSSVAGT